jgi:hypothetical protein
MKVLKSGDDSSVKRPHGHGWALLFAGACALAGGLYVALETPDPVPAMVSSAPPVPVVAPAPAPACGLGVLPRRNPTYAPPGAYLGRNRPCVRSPITGGWEPAPAPIMGLPTRKGPSLVSPDYPRPCRRSLATGEWAPAPVPVMGLPTRKGPSHARPGAHLKPQLDIPHRGPLGRY